MAAHFSKHIFFIFIIISCGACSSVSESRFDSLVQGQQGLPHPSNKVLDNAIQTVHIYNGWQAVEQYENGTLARQYVYGGRFRLTVKSAFKEMEDMHKMKKQALGRRKTDLSNMQDRLLTAFLAGSIDEAVFQAKSAQLKDDMEEVEEALDEANRYDPAAPERALAVFDFSQNLVKLWHGSNVEGKRDILECVSLNRTVTDLSLDVVKRKPFDFLAERRFLEDGRGDRI